MSKRLFSWFCVLVICVSCHKDVKENFYSRGGELSFQLCSELSQVQDLQGLFERQERLANLFEQIAVLAVEAHKFSERTKQCSEDNCRGDGELNLLLSEQFQRVLMIAGAEALLERCQARAVEILSLQESALCPG